MIEIDTALRRTLLTLTGLTLLHASTSGAPAVGGGDGEKAKAYATEPRGAARGGLPELFTAMLDPASCCSTKTCGAEGAAPEAAPCAGETLGKLLWERPGAWKVLGSVAVERFAAADAAERGRILDFVTWEPTPAICDLGDELWKRGPDAFREEHLLAFGQAGSPVVLAVLEARVAEAPEKGAAALRPATVLALRGNAIGRDVLRREVEGLTKNCESFVDAWVAALALQKLGEVGVLAGVQEQVHGAVLAALDQGDFERAQRVAAEAQFLHNSFSKQGYVPSLARIHGDAAGFQVKMAERLSTPEDIFALIERVLEI